MIRAALNGYAERVKFQRSLAYDTAILPMLKDTPSRAAYLGEEDAEGGVADTADAMFAVIAAIPGAVVTVED